MNELQKLYDVLVREGKYTKSFEEFQNQWNDEQYQSKVYEVVHRDGLYTKDRESFNQKYVSFGQKKNDGQQDFGDGSDQTQQSGGLQPSQGKSVMEQAAEIISGPKRTTLSQVEEVEAGTAAPAEFGLQGIRKIKGPSIEAVAESTAPQMPGFVQKAQQEVQKKQKPKDNIFEYKPTQLEAEQIAVNQEARDVRATEDFTYNYMNETMYKIYEDSDLPGIESSLLNLESDFKKGMFAGKEDEYQALKKDLASKKEDIYSRLEKTYLYLLANDDPKTYKEYSERREGILKDLKKAGYSSWDDYQYKRDLQGAKGEIFSDDSFDVVDKADQIFLRKFRMDVINQITPTDKNNEGMYIPGLGKGYGDQGKVRSFHQSIQPILTDFDALMIENKAFEDGYAAGEYTEAQAQAKYKELKSKENDLSGRLDQAKKDAEITDFDIKRYEVAARKQEALAATFSEGFKDLKRAEDYVRTEQENRQRWVAQNPVLGTLTYFVPTVWEALSDQTAISLAKSVKPLAETVGLGEGYGWTDALYYGAKDVQENRQALYGYSGQDINGDGEVDDLPSFAKYGNILGQGVGSLLAFLMPASAANKLFVGTSKAMRAGRFATNWASGILMMEGTAYDEAIAAGLTGTDAAQSATLIATLQAAAEASIPDIAYLESSVQRAGLLSMLKAGKITKKQAFENGMKYIGELALTSSKSAVKEGGEEVVGQFATDIGKSISNDAFVIGAHSDLNNPLNPEYSTRPYDKLWEMKNYTDAAIGGALTGGFIKMLAGAKRVYTKNEMEALSYMGQNWNSILTNIQQTASNRTGKNAENFDDIEKDLKGIGALYQSLKSMPGFKELTKANQDMVLSLVFRKKSLQDNVKNLGIELPSVREMLAGIDETIDGYMTGKLDYGADKPVSYIDDNLAAMGIAIVSVNPDGTYNIEVKDIKGVDPAESVKKAEAYIQKNLKDPAFAGAFLHPKTNKDAVQKQTTNEVPVQSETGVSKEVERGTPTTETQVTTEEVKKEEVVTPEMQSKIDEIEARRQKELVPEFGVSLNNLFERGYPEELDNKGDNNVIDRIEKGRKYLNDKINAKYDAEIADLKATPAAETTTTEAVTTPVTEVPATKDVFKIDGVEYDQDQAIEKTKEAEIKWGSKMEYSGENEQAKAFADDYNKRTNPYNEDGKLKSQYIQARIAEALNKLPFKKFAELYRKHINPTFSSRNYKLRKGTTFQQEAPYIIGNATFDSKEATDQFLAFAKEAGIEVAPTTAVEATPVAKPAPVAEAPAVEVPVAEAKPKAKPTKKAEPASAPKGKSLLTDKVRKQIADIAAKWKKTRERYIKRTGEEPLSEIEIEIHTYDADGVEDLEDQIDFTGIKNINKVIEDIRKQYPNLSRIDFKYPTQDDGGDWNWITIYEVEAPAAAEAVVEEAPVVEAAPAPKAEPAPTPTPAPAKKTAAEKKLDEEMQQLMLEIDSAQDKVEQLKEEIEIEKGNTKEGIAEIKERMAEVKQKIADRKKSGLPKATIKTLVDELQNELEEIEAELEAFREDQANQIEIYKEDIAQEKADIKKAQRRLDKLTAKKEQATQPEAAPKKPGEMSMAEVEKRFPLVAKFLAIRKYNLSKITAKDSLNMLTAAYNNLMRFKTGAEELLLQIEQIEDLVETLDQGVRKVSKEEFKKQMTESGDFTEAQLKIFNALVDSLQTELMPEYISEKEAAQYKIGENFYMTFSNQIISKEPNAFIHEIGHFAFYKILSKEDRLKYYRYMIDSTYGKGKPSLASRLALSADRVVGRNAEGQETTAVFNVADNFSEYFAEQFRQWYMSERLFPKEIDTIFERVAQFFNLFIEKLKSGKYVDKNLSEYFNKISVKTQKQQKKNEKIQDALGIEETMMNELQDLEDFFGIDPEISPMSMRYDTPLQKMALMYNMTETGFFPRNASEPHINKDFFQFGLKAKRATSGSYYLVNIKTGKMVKPLQRPKGGIPPQASRMSVTISPNERTEWKKYKVGDVIDGNKLDELSGGFVGNQPNEKFILVQTPLSELNNYKYNREYLSTYDEEYEGEEIDRLESIKEDFDLTPPLPPEGDGVHRVIAAKELGHQTILQWKNVKTIEGIPTQVSPMSVTPISIKDMPMDDVIETARENGFSDDVIKALLMKRGYAAKDIDSSLTFNINFASAYTNNNPRTDSPLPRAFRTLDGGVNAGIKLFFDVRNKLIDFAKSDPKKKKTYAEIRAKAIELLKANPIFQGQEDTKQLELIAAFDKTLNITRGKAISAQIADIRKAIKERLEGVKDLKKAQLILRNFIRQSLPAVKVPRVFFNLEGLTSPAEGINFFNGLRKQIYDFARTDASGVVGKKILVKDAEKIKEFSMKLLKSTELYKKQSPAVQADMENALINSQYTKGPSHTLDIYSQREVNKLIDIVSQTDSKNFLSQAEKVFDIITEQRAKIKNGLLKEMMTLVNKKATSKKTSSGKVRSNGLDAQGQAFYKSIKPIIVAAIKNDTEAMIKIADELSDLAAIQDALDKEAFGEDLTTLERDLLDKVYAFDTFGDILNMELEEVQDLLDGLKGVRSASIVRLNQKRADRAAQREAMMREADEQIKRDFKALYNPDGTLKDKNELNNDRAMIWQSFKELKIWSGVQQWLERYDFFTSPISDYFRKKIAHLGSLSNILDKSGTFFTDNLYRLTNRMDEVSKAGYLNEMSNLDDLANSVKGVTKGYKQIRRLIESVGVVKMVINGKNVIYNGDQLLRIYALSLNEVQRNKLKNMGFTEDKLNDIKNKLGPETLEFADKLVEYFSNEYFESINNVYSFVNDINLGYVENYFPTQTVAQAKNQEKVIDEGLISGNFTGIFDAESSPALKERTDLSNPIDLAPSFTNVVESHFQSMERYKAYAEGVKKLNDLFKIESVNTLLEQTGLKSIVKNLVNNAVNPNAGVKQVETRLSSAMNKFSGFALAFKLMQIPKQAIAITSAYEDYQFLKNRKDPVLDFLMFSFDVAKTLTFARANFNKFYNLSANFRDRIAKGVEGDVYGLESGGKVFKPLSQKATKLADVKRFIKSSAAAPTMVGDIISVYGYMANYNRDIANGMSPEAALEKFNNYNAALQTRRAADKGTLQFSQNELTRAFTMFTSVSMLQINKVAISSKNIMRSIANGKVPSAKDIRAFAINLGVGNALFVAVSNIFILLKGDDEDKEKVYKKILEALVGLNLLYQVPLIGVFVEEAVSMIKGEKFLGGDVTNPYTSVLRKIKKYYEDDNTVIENFRPAAEFALGMQLDPFIGLYEGATDEFNDDVLYDILGVSPSYRPQNNSSLEKMSKSELKKYNPDEYERLYGPGSEDYDEEQAKKEAKAAERKARKDAMDDYYNYESGDGTKRGGSRIKSRGSRTSGSRIK